VRAPWRRGGQAPDKTFGVVLPDHIEVEARRLAIGDTFHHTMAVTGYPAEARLGWLEPLVTHPGPADIALHVEPIPAAAAAERMRRQLARLESSRRLDAAKGRLVDPALDASATDARALADRLARGEGRLFSVGLAATCRGADVEDLHRQAGRLRALCDSLLLDTVPATYRALPGWLTTLPLGLDLLRLRRTMDTAALSAAFPFASAELSEPAGVLWGRNARSGGLVFWDRFAQPNYNAVILARSGAGKSYLAKLELLRWLYAGVEAAVIDPEDEYARLTGAVGGTYLHLGSSGVRLNPFDLDDQPDALTRRALFCHTLIAVLVGEAPDPGARAALDAAIVAAYAARGVTADPATQRRPAPTLADLTDALRAQADGAGPALAARLAPFVTGTHRQLFDGPTTTSPDGHLVTFSLRHLPDELKAAGTLLVLDAVWRRVTDPARRRRRMVVVDEAWLLMKDPAGAAFLHRLAKSARKHWCGLTVVTQDAADLLASDLGQAVVANAATQVLLRQAPQALDLLAGPFRLTNGEAAFLGAAGVGEGILLAGNERVGFAALASPAEHRLITTDPAEAEADRADDDDRAGDDGAEY
jgi:type IV secretory pathway VirB4 component